MCILSSSKDGMKFNVLTNFIYIFYTLLYAIKSSKTNKNFLTLTNNSKSYLIKIHEHFLYINKKFTITKYKTN